MKTARVLMAAILSAITAFAAAPASAIPDTTASTAAARIDAQIKPRFGALLRPPLHRYRPWSARWRYGRWWNPIYRNNRWCYEYEFLPEYQGVRDEFGYPYEYNTPAGYGGYGGGYPDAYAQGGYPGGGYADPAYAQGGYGQGGYGGPGYGGQAYAPGVTYNSGVVVGPSYPGAVYTGEVGGPSYSVTSGPLADYGHGFGGDFVRHEGAALAPEARWGGEQSIQVDCSGAHGPTLQDAVDQVGEGGTVYIRGDGGSCRRTVEITHSMSLVGVERGAFDPEQRGPARLTASNNAPCIRVLPSVRRVELRNLLIEQGAGGRAGCIQSFGAEIAISQSTIRYVGEGCAVYVGGGKLLLLNTVIDADTPDAAVLAEGASVDAKQVRIRTRGTGMDISAGGPSGVHADGVTLLTGGDGAPRGEVGVIVRGRGGSETDLRHMAIDGFRVGAWMERGGHVSIASTWIGRAELGVVSDGADISVQDSVIAARDVGVYVMTGKALITHNRIVEFTDSPVDADRFADVTVSENWIYPKGGCGPFGGWHSWCRGSGFGARLGFDISASFGWEGSGFDYPDGYRRGEDTGFDWRRRGGGTFRGHDYRPPRSLAPDRPL